MSNLASFSVLNEKVKQIHEEEQTETVGTAFIRLGLEVILKLNEDELQEAITDGPMDGEIDAIYVESGTIHIFTFKYTDSFQFTKKNYPEADLDQFILTIDNIISGNLDRKTVNDAVWDKYTEITDLATKGKIEFKIYVVSNKLRPVAHAERKLLNKLEKFRIVEGAIFYDQEDLVDKILENKIVPIDGQLRFIDRQYFEKSNGGIRTLVGTIPAKDLISLIEDKNRSKHINEDIFNENVRVYKPKHRINKAIIDSAKQESNYQFFYMNNGITILCEDIDYRPNTHSPLVELKNVQIINGGQTSHSLFEVYKSDEEKLETVELLVRICIVRKNDPISETISETSNSQIPVGSRDLHANDLIQRKLEEEFSALGYYYERKPNQYLDKPKSLVLNNELLGQLYISYHLNMPSEAKNSKTRVFTDLYDKVFEENSISATELLKLFSIYTPLAELKKVIQTKKRKKEKINEEEAFISRGTFHLLNAIKWLLEKDLELLAETVIKKPKDREKAISEILKKNLNSYIERSIMLVSEVVKKEKQARGDLYTHDKFFKEIPTNNIIQNHIQKNLLSKENKAC